ncbi:MAG TPA: hypothetical protein VMT57_09525 [Candidatus Thermoplasmatota archaeon]|nr:hypothetical protein [Candidatus Thermoplasmatota archaeon]
MVETVCAKCFRVFEDLQEIVDFNGMKYHSYCLKLKSTANR